MLVIACITLSAAHLMLGLTDEFGADGLGEIAWELAHGLPAWRRKFRQGWRDTAERHRGPQAQ